MMSIEGPYLSALIARMPLPKYNLAAYGVAFSFALIAEAPIIMIMSAAAALVENKQSYIKLRNFTNILNVILTVIMALCLLPPVFDFYDRASISHDQILSIFEGSDDNIWVGTNGSCFQSMA